MVRLLIMIGSAFLLPVIALPKAAEPSAVAITEGANVPVEQSYKKGFFASLFKKSTAVRRQGRDEGLLTADEKAELYRRLGQNQEESRKGGAAHYTALTVKGLYQVVKWALRVLHKGIIFAADVLRLVLLFMLITRGCVVPIVSLVL